MEFTAFSSGSAGNCYRVAMPGSPPLLLEAGIAFKDLQRALGFRVSGLAGVLVSHSHADHSRAAIDLMKHGVDVYLLEATAREIGATGHRAHAIRPLEQFSVGPWTVLPFPLEHDVSNAGFLIANGAEKWLYATDTEYVRYRFAGLTGIAIEANHSLDILDAQVAAGTIDHELRNRVRKSHMSLETAKDLLRANDLSRVEQIWLLHLSDGNSDAARFRREVMELTGIPVYVAPARAVVQ